MLRHEGKVCSTFLSLADNDPDRLWFEFSNSFNPDLAQDHQVDILARFPGIQAALANGEFKGEHAAAAAALKKTNFGKFFLQGGPGSGKSTFAQTCITGALAGPTKMASGDCRTRVAYTIGMNQLVTDAEAAFVRRNPTSSSVRAFAWKTERKCILYEPPVDDKALPKEGGFRHVSAIALRDHLRDVIIQDRELHSPREHPRSICSLVRKRIADNPDDPDYRRIIEGWAQQVSDPDAFKENKAELKELIKKLMERVLEEVDAIFCTPHCLKDIHDNTGVFIPTLLVIDEAGFLSETACLVPISVCPKAATLVIGDPNQFRPIVDSYKSSFTFMPDGKDGAKISFVDLVSEQRRLPILARTEALQRVDFTLHDNHRIFGSAGHYMCRHLFDGTMNMVHTVNSAATASVHEYFLDNFGADNNTMWFDIKDGVEEPSGTSYKNSAESHFGVELAVQVLRDLNAPNMDDYLAFQRGELAVDKIRRFRVLIITMYAQHREMVRTRLSSIPAHEIDHSRIEVRTVDESLSHQAEFVILLTGRSIRAGHTKDIFRSNVALTRHMLAMVTICSSKFVRSLPPNLKHYRDYHETHKYIMLDLNGWDRWCTQCCQHGHEATRCVEKITCNLCGQKHAGRNCRRAKKSHIIANEVWTDKTRFTAIQKKKAMKAALEEGKGKSESPSDTVSATTTPDEGKSKKEEKKQLDDCPRSLFYKTLPQQLGKKEKINIQSTTQQIVVRRTMALARRKNDMAKTAVLVTPSIRNNRLRAQAAGRVAPQDSVDASASGDDCTTANESPSDQVGDDNVGEGWHQLSDNTGEGWAQLSDNTGEGWAQLGDNAGADSGNIW
ncbi:hypothetical protein NQ176_g5580 [Zarea fungicola]|uniref:Uncharacterized protein n=1 Tax=Zarea fungicola TaxID=93591 RepID=A0ACC1N8J2_9HYPO|nr:hypothetical protein NQ176_g5580 [Lecanicillium fungicola]